MPQAVTVDRASFQQVSGDTVSMISALMPDPRHGLARVVLLVADVRDVGHFGQGVREVFEYSTEHGSFLSVLFS
jgi:hypothetical protein